MNATGPEAFLARFAGDLQADAYTGYDALYRTGRIRELGCWAHARRGFVEALPTDARAAPMIALIQQLYQVERAVADEAAEIRRARRVEASVPLLGAIRAEREALAATVLPKSPLGEAMRYLTNQWDALQRFVEDGRFRIDNNGAENQLRGRRDRPQELVIRGQLRGRPTGRAPLFPRPELHADRGLALRLSEGRPRARGHASAAPARGTDAARLGRDLRPARRRLSRRFRPYREETGTWISAVKTPSVERLPQWSNAGKRRVQRCSAQGSGPLVTLFYTRPNFTRPICRAPRLTTLICAAPNFIKLI